MDLNKICVYCGSSDKIESHFLEAADKMGATIAARGMTIIYGGGSTGMMGAMADAALQAGGEVIGVLPQFFATPELAHNSLTQLHQVDNMHERKAMMANLADGFLALPGGFGTFEELFEILTWAQIGLHSRPIGTLNIDEYFDPLHELIDHASQTGFIYTEHRKLLKSDRDPERLLDQMSGYQPPEGLESWVNRREEQL